MTKAGNDTITIQPTLGLKGEVSVPGDKSISHRAVILGSIAEGITEVEGFLEGEDNLSTLAAFKEMGVGIERAGTSVRIDGKGAGGLKEPADVIDAHNSGTTARLLTGLLSAQPFFSVITGDASLRKRPMRRVVVPLLDMGASIIGRADAGLLPLAIKGQRLKGITYKTPVASAQLKSALLLAGLHAEGETIVEEPEKSRDHTERMLKAFGADIAVHGCRVRVSSANTLKGCRVVVPGDISSAAFFIVGALITLQSDLLIKDVGFNPTRIGVINILRRMGGSIDVLNEREVSGEPVADIRVRSSRMKCANISGADLLPAIDEFPIICVAAAFAEGNTIISGAEELRVKESDRIAVMSSALHAVGVLSREKADGVLINGIGSVWNDRSIKGGAIDSFGDHRIAMSFAIAALRSETGIVINNPACATVSFPGFYDLLKGISV